MRERELLLLASLLVPDVATVTGTEKKGL
ncbi:BnaA01g21640D [Brassica napus]|uniref:BnaA01g21640D protein n=1 Tax=Brassica napus TaxID=3708 RepID=A0A078GGQ1_BRANA|nr:BnaA01g21640D [Brassica napus]